MGIGEIKFEARAYVVELNDKSMNNIRVTTHVCLISINCGVTHNINIYMFSYWLTAN